MAPRELASVRFTGGLPETPCGAGSTLKTTEHLRSQLPNLLRSLGVCSLVDAPCGDNNWISQTDLRGIHYHGIDLNDANLRLAIERTHHDGFAPLSRMFESNDLTLCDLPQADAILCRDFFQHLPNSKVIALLEKIARSKFKWLLATSFDNEVNQEVGPELFRPLNLMAAPFYLAEPLEAIEDPPGSGRIIGAWPL
jgi:hypothetical protein